MNYTSEGDFRDWKEKAKENFRNKNYNEAIKFYKKIIDLEPENSSHWCNIGKAYIELRKNKEAIESYEKAVEINPLNSLAYKKLSELKGIEKRKKEIKFYEKIFGSEPENSLKMNNIKELKKQIKELGLSQFEKEIISMGRVSYQLKRGLIDEDSIEIGISKLGGEPDFPQDFEWPRWKDVPLSFLAQINLQDLDLSSDDPKNNGILYFFYSADWDVLGWKPEIYNVLKVLYYNGDKSKLEEVAYPEDSDSIRFIKEITLPWNCENNRLLYYMDCAELYEQEKRSSKDIELEGKEDFIWYAKIAHLNLNDDEICSYIKLLNIMRDVKNYGNIPRLFGHADYVQNGFMEEYCIKCSSSLNKDKLDKQEGYIECELLLQLPLNGGTVYYWMNKGEFKKKDFSKVWVFYDQT